MALMGLILIDVDVEADKPIQVADLSRRCPPPYIRPPCARLCTETHYTVYQSRPLPPQTYPQRLSLRNSRTSSSWMFLRAFWYAAARVLPRPMNAFHDPVTAAL